MKKIILFLAFSLFAAGFCAGEIWVGNIDGNWSTAANWSPATVPSLTSDVVITGPCTYYPTITGTASCKNLTIGGGAATQLALSTGATLKAYGNIDVNPSCPNGIISDSTSTIELAGGSTVTPATFRIERAQDGSLLITGHYQCNNDYNFQARSIEVRGSLLKGGASSTQAYSLSVSDTGDFYINGGTFDIGTGVIIDIGSGSTGNFTETNTGKIIGSGTISIQALQGGISAASSLNTISSVKFDTQDAITFRTSAPTLNIVDYIKTIDNNITLTARNIGTSGIVDAGTETVTIAPHTPSSGIYIRDIGAEMSIPTLFLQNIIAKMLVIGGASATGAIYIGYSGAIDLSSSPYDMTLQTSGALNFSSSNLSLGIKTLYVDIGGNINNASSAATNITAGTLTVTKAANIGTLAAKLNTSIGILNGGGLANTKSVFINNTGKNLAVNVAIGSASSSTTAVNISAGTTTYSLTIAGAITATGSAGTITLTGAPIIINTPALTSRGAQIYTGATQLNQDLTFDSIFGNGVITFSSTLNGNADNTISVDFKSGNGAITFGGVVGGINRLKDLTLTSGKVATGASNITIGGNLSVGATANVATLNSGARTITVGGDITIGTVATLNGETGTIKLGGNWTKNGNDPFKFNSGTGTVEFIGAGTSVITGVNIFYNFTCTVAKTIKMPARASATTPVRQRVNNIITLDNVTLTTAHGTPSADSNLTWFELYVRENNTDHVFVQNTTISYGYSDTDLRGTGLVGGGVANVNLIEGSTYWFFYPSIYKWTGLSTPATTAWNVSSNWLNADPPPLDDISRPSPANIIIPNLLPNLSPVTNFPVLNVPIAHNGIITIESNAKLDLNARVISVDQIDNYGSLRLRGTEVAQVTTKINETGSTVEYYGAGDILTYFENSTAPQYYNLNINKTSGTWIADQAISANKIINTRPTSGAAKIQIKQNITVTDSATFEDDISLLGVSAAITIESTTNGPINLKKIDGAKALTITTVAGTVKFDGLVGSITQLNSLAVTGDTTINGSITTSGLLNITGAATINANITTGGILNITGSTTINTSAITTVGDQTYGGATVLRQNVTLGTITGNITFSSTLDGFANNTQSAEINTNGNIVFGGIVGGTHPLKNLTLINGTVPASAVDINIGGNLTLGSGGNFSADSRTLNVGGNLRILSGLYFGGGTSTIDVGGNLSLEGGSVQAQTSAITVGGNLSLEGGSGNLFGNNSTISVTGNLSIGTGVTLVGDASIISVTGNLSIGTGATLTSTTGTIKVGGNWTREGTFTCGTGAVEFTGTGTSVITGANTFYKFTCTAVKTIKMPARTSASTPVQQTVSDAITLNGPTLTSAAAAPSANNLTWFELQVDNLASVSVSNTTISYGYSVRDLRDIVHGGVANTNGGSTRWFFYKTDDYVWTGLSNPSTTDWDDLGNWLNEDAPPEDDVAILPPTAARVRIPYVSSPAVFPLLNVPILHNEKITIESNASLDLNGKICNVEEVDNYGTLRLQGTEVGLVATKTNRTGSTVEYYGSSFITSYFESDTGMTYSTLKINRLSGTWDVRDGYPISAYKIENTAAGTSKIQIWANITVTQSATFEDDIYLMNPSPPITIDCTTSGAISFKKIAGPRGLVVTTGGTVTFNDVVGTGPYPASLAVTGRTTINANITTTGILSITGATTIGDASAITINTNGAQSYNGAVTLKQNVTLNTINVNITFTGSINGTATGAQNFTLALGTGTATFHGYLGAGRALGDIIIDCGRIELPNGSGMYSGKSITLKTSSVGAITIQGNLALSASTAAYPAGGISFPQRTRHNGDLNLIRGTCDIGMSYYMYTEIDVPVIAFYGSAPAKLTMGTNTSLVFASGLGRSFRTTAGFILNVDPSSTVKMNGTGSIILGSPTTQILGNLDISSATMITADSDIILSGNWTQAAAPATSNFTPGTYKVTFTGTQVSIIGNTTWYDFVANTPGATIKFSNWSAAGNAHKFTHSITITGTAASPITLDCISPVSSYPSSPPSPTTGYWVIDISAVGATYNFQYIEVYHSFAYAYASGSPIEDGEIFYFLQEVKTAKTTPYWTVNWKREEFYLLYSFTEDSNGDGRIDRVRFQTTMNMSAGSSPGSCKINVNDGTYTYRVIGYERVSGSDDMLYAYLEPRGTPDTGATLTWNLVNSGNFVCAKNERIPLSNPPDGFALTVDTAPPRISYSFTCPGTTSEYIRFTESVTGVSGSFDFANGTTITTITSAPNVEYLFTLDTPFSAAEIAGDTDIVRYDERVFQTAVRDIPALAQWRPVPPTLEISPPAPQYPLDFTYSVYEHIDTSNPYPQGIDGTSPSMDGSTSDIANSDGGMKFQLSPSAAWSGGTLRRVSDLLLLEENTSGNLWTSYAEDEFVAIPGGPTRGTDETSIVRRWDGSGTLLFSAISIFARDEIILSTAPSLLFGISVPDEYRRDPAKGNLWLPPISPNAQHPYYDVALNIIPKVFSTAKSPLVPPETFSHSGETPPFNVYQYLLKKDELQNPGTMDFIYQIPNASPALYAARVDNVGAWYNNIKPFSLIVKDIARQRGGVTVLKNVIKPLNGDKVSINYVLTQSGAVNINVFTLDGKTVKTIERGRRDIGEYYIEWDGKNTGGNVVARGIYFIRIVAPDIDEIRKVIVVK